MSRHRPRRRPSTPSVVAPSAPAPTRHSTIAANGASAPPGDATADLLALRAEIEEARRDLNARLDRLAQAVDRLLPRVHPAAAEQRSISLTPVEAEQGPTVPAPAAAEQHPAAPGIVVGQDVYVPRLGGTFAIVEVSPSGRTFKVQHGTLRVRVRSDEVGAPDEGNLTGSGRPAEGTAVSPRPDLNTHISEIDLHGFSQRDALVTLEMFLHHAFTQRTPRVRIIHGKGNGTLRTAVRRELARHPLVRLVDTGPQYRGDEGVTLAELDV